MRDELRDSLWRYEAMTGLIDWEDESAPGQEDRDQAAYGTEYGLTPCPDGQQQASYARMVRFLVEVCGHSYEESLEALVEHFRAMPGAYRADANPEDDARQIMSAAENIIEALFDLKVGRLIHGDDEGALDYNRRTTRKLMTLTRAPGVPGEDLG
jgi:hypothetical protein